MHMLRTLVDALQGLPVRLAARDDLLQVHDVGVPAHLQHTDLAAGGDRDAWAAHARLQQGKGLSQHGMRNHSMACVI